MKWIKIEGSNFPKDTELLITYNLFRQLIWLKAEYISEFAVPYMTTSDEIEKEDCVTGPNDGLYWPKGWYVVYDDRRVLDEQIKPLYYMEIELPVESETID